MGNMHVPAFPLRHYIAARADWHSITEDPSSGQVILFLLTSNTFDQTRCCVCTA
jgi:hypothetical protein